MKYIILVFLTFIGLQQSFAQDSKKRQLIESLASPLPSDKTFFRWQSKTAGDNLIKEGIFSDKLYKYFMGMKIDSYHFAAGHGIYISENPHSSSQFIRGGGEGSLIEVKLEKGTKYLDLTSQKTLNLLSKNGISANDVYRLNPNIAVKYSAENKWWVLKGQEGIHFQRFTGNNIKTGYLINVLNNIDDGQASQIYRTELKRVLKARVKISPELLKDVKVLNLFSKEEIAQLKKTIFNFDQIKSKKELLEQINDIKRSASLANLLEDSKKQELFFNSANKYLTGEEIFEIINDLPQKLQKQIIKLGSINAHPKKYSDLLLQYQKTISKNNLEKLKLGPFPNSTVTTGATSQTTAEITKSLKSLNFEVKQISEMITRNKEIESNINLIQSYAINIGDKKLAESAKTAYLTSFSYNNSLLKSKPTLEKLIKTINVISNQNQLKEFAQTLNQISTTNIEPRLIHEALLGKMKSLKMNEKQMLTLFNKLDNNIGKRVREFAQVHLARELNTIDEYIQFIDQLPSGNVNEHFISNTLNNFEFKDLNSEKRLKLLFSLQKNNPQVVTDVSTYLMNSAKSAPDYLEIAKDITKVLKEEQTSQVITLTYSNFLKYNPDVISATDLLMQNGITQKVKNQTHAYILEIIKSKPLDYDGLIALTRTIDLTDKSSQQYITFLEELLKVKSPPTDEMITLMNNLINFHYKGNSKFPNEMLLTIENYLNSAQDYAQYTEILPDAEKFIRSEVIRYNYNSERVWNKNDIKDYHRLFINTKERFLSNELDADNALSLTKKVVIPQNKIANNLPKTSELTKSINEILSAINDPEEYIKFVRELYELKNITPQEVTKLLINNKEHFQSIQTLSDHSVKLKGIVITKDSDIRSNALISLLDNNISKFQDFTSLSYQQALRGANNATINNPELYFKYLNQAIETSNGVDQELVNFLRRLENKDLKHTKDYFNSLSNMLKKAKTPEQFQNILPKISNISHAYFMNGDSRYFAGWDKKTVQKLVDIVDENLKIKLPSFGLDDYIGIQEKIFSGAPNAKGKILFQADYMDKLLHHLQSPDQFIEYINYLQSKKLVNKEIFATNFQQALEHFHKLSPNLEQYTRLKGIITKLDLNAKNKISANKYVTTYELIDDKIEVLKKISSLSYDDAIKMAKNSSVNNAKDYLYFIEKAMEQTNNTTDIIIDMLSEYTRTSKPIDEYYDVLTLALKKANDKEQYIKILPQLDDIAEYEYRLSTYGTRELYGFESDVQDKLIRSYELSKDNFFKVNTKSEDLIRIQNKIITGKAKFWTNSDYIYHPDKMKSFLRSFDDPNEYLKHVEKMAQINKMNKIDFGRSIYRTLDHFQQLNPGLAEYTKLKGLIKTYNMDIQIEFSKKDIRYFSSVVEDEIAKVSKNVILDYDNAIKMAKNTTAKNAEDYLRYVAQAIDQTAEMTPELITLIRDYELLHKTDPQYFNVLSSALAKAKDKKQYIKILPDLGIIADLENEYNHYNASWEYVGYNKEVQDELLKVHNKNRLKFYPNGLTADEAFTIQNKILTGVEKSKYYKDKIYYHPIKHVEIFKSLNSPEEYLKYIEKILSLKGINQYDFARAIYRTLDDFQHLNPDLAEYTKLKGLIKSKNMDLDIVLSKKEKILFTKILDDHIQLVRKSTKLNYDEAIKLAKNATAANEKDYLDYLGHAVNDTKKTNQEIIDLIRAYEKSAKNVDPQYYLLLENALNKAINTTQYFEILPEIKNIANRERGLLNNGREYIKGYNAETQKKVLDVIIKSKQNFFPNGSITFDDAMKLEAKILQYKDSWSYYINLDSLGKISQLFDNPDELIKYLNHIYSMKDHNKYVLARNLNPMLDHFLTLAPNYSQYQELSKILNKSNETAEVFNQYLIKEAKNMFVNSKDINEYSLAMKHIDEMQGAFSSGGEVIQKKFNNDVYTYAKNKAKVLQLSADEMISVQKGLQRVPATFNNCDRGLKAVLSNLKIKMGLIK